MNAEVKAVKRPSRTARVKQAVKAVASSVVPSALKPAPKAAITAPTTVNPLQETSESMRAVEREMSNAFLGAEDAVPSFKIGRLSRRGFPSHAGFSTHETAQGNESNQGANAPSEGGFWG